MKHYLTPGVGAFLAFVLFFLMVWPLFTWPTGALAGESSYWTCEDDGFEPEDLTVQPDYYQGPAPESAPVPIPEGDDPVYACVLDIAPLETMPMVNVPHPLWPWRMPALFFCAFLCAVGGAHLVRDWATRAERDKG